jgi:bifunctional non-homologous end joining protein LigD
MPAKRVRYSGAESAGDRLGRYHDKRSFGRTPEPAGAQPAAADGVRHFVVQRHRASRLHYDLRFEIDGVLVSWAVPRGPTLDPGTRHMAVHVEDHPIEYADFEGVIPSGEYGGGDVIVWDRGTWEPHGTDDPAAAVAAGELHAEMHGEKLQGRLVLVRRDKTRSRRNADKDEWLLLHKHDDHAVDGWDPEDHPRSVISGRTNEEVAADPELQWHSDRPAAEAAERVSWPDAGPDELAALDDLASSGGQWEIFGRTLKVTNLDKALFPGRDGEPPVTKRDLLRYTARVAPTVVPYLRGRPLNMHRYPNGADKPGFWHKARPKHAPEWVSGWDNPNADPGETETYVVVDQPATLLWCANFGALEWHPWTSTTDRPDLPSYVMLDIDPGTSTSWDDVLVLARLHRTALEHLGVRAAPKVTGRRGIQVWVPVTTGPDFAETRAWAERLSHAVGAVIPELVSWKWDVSSRGGQARLDYTQNAVNKTLVAPYSPRASAGAPVSMPITWDELDDPALRPDGFPLRTVPERLAQRGDLFAPVLQRDQALPPLEAGTGQA